MNWWIAVPVGWMLVALGLGLFVARGIRVGAGDEPECVVVPEGPTELATVASTADPASARVADERRGAVNPASSLAAAH